MILPNIKRWRAPFIGVLVGCCIAIASLDLVLVAEEVEQEEEVNPSVQLETFDLVWETVHRSFHDPEFGGVDWEGMKEEYRPQAAEAKDTEALRPILNAMLMELGVSHFGVFPQYEELTGTGALADSEVDSEDEESESEDADDVEEEEEEALDDVEEEEEASGTYSGIHVRLDRDEVIISQVDHESPAMRAGLRAGYVIRKIGDLDVREMYKTAREKVENHFEYVFVSAVQEILSASDNGRQVLEVEVDWGKVRKFEVGMIEYEGRMSQPVVNLPAVPLRFDTKILPVMEGEVLYLHFNMFLPELMPEIRKALRQEREFQGVILDLRGNPGGVGAMANGVAGLLVDEKTVLGTMEMRAGTIPFIAYPQSKAFLGPLVLIVDELSASTSEILAGGLQEAGRAHVIGRTTMGAALPSYIVQLPNSDLFQYAVADFTTPEGVRLEGDGVTPDIEVPLDRRKLTKGRDEPLEKALKWIHRESRPD